jgi:hypothetical protein
LGNGGTAQKRSSRNRKKLYSYQTNKIPFKVIMEQLTTYRAKGKEIGLVFLFKYDLNGNLKLFEIIEGVLNKEQRHWLLTGFLPKGVKFEDTKQLLAQLEPRFPDEEKTMKDIWMKDEKYTKVFVVEPSPADISFNAAWVNYNLKISKPEAEKAFKKMNEAEVIKFFNSLPEYERYLKMSGIAKCHMSTYINKRYYENEYPEAVSTKNFNPMIADFAKSKTNRRI